VFVPPSVYQNSQIIIVGEAPGAQEATQKVPFIGESGQLLRKTLGDVGFDVPSITFTNVCKCFAEPKLPIYTSKGWKHIQDIKIGDLVLTHKMRFRKVTKTMLGDKKYNGDLLSIGITYTTPVNKSVRSVSLSSITPEHPILTKRGWVVAGNIKVGDYIYILGSTCKHCGKSYFDGGEKVEGFCSVSCKNTYILHVPGSQEKRVFALRNAPMDLKLRRVRKANEVTREIVSKGLHLFQQEDRFSRFSENGRKKIRLGRIKAAETWKKNPNNSLHIASVGRNTLNKYYETHKRMPPLIGMKPTYPQLKLAEHLKDLGLSVLINTYIKPYFPDIMVNNTVIIEVDGEYWHKNRKDEDAKRQKYLEDKGYTVIRFTAKKALKERAECANEVIRILNNHSGVYQGFWIEVTSVRRNKTTKDGRYKKLYNFSVEEDESYIAKGFIVHNCHPPGNEQPHKKAQELCTKMYLFNEIKEQNPKLVVLAGATALNVFFPKESIMNKAGNLLEAQGLKFLPVLHPAYCLRNPTSLPRLRKDLKKAFQYINNELSNNRNLIAVRSPDLLEQARQDLIIKAPSMLSFDVETNELLDVFDKTMTLWTIGFSANEETGYSIPLDHPENDNIEFREKCWALAREIMMGRSQKIAHNAAFDLKVLKKLGVPYKNFYADTMIMAFLLDENRYSFGLKQLSSEYLDGYMYEFTKDLQKLCCYNSEDCLNTMSLYRKFEPELRKFPRLWDLLEKVIMPMVDVIVDMELNGVLIDIKASTKLAGDLHRKLDAVYESIADKFPQSKGINLNSTKQLKELMFVKLKYPHGRLTDKGEEMAKSMGGKHKMTKDEINENLSTDNEVLENLSRKGYKLATYLLKIRKYEKLLSTYVEKLPELIKSDGKIHCNFNQCGAKTGRMSSSGPNLQNIPVDKLVKSMFIASPGCVLLQCDASQAELRVGCSVALEPTMIKAYQDGKDIHRLTASTALNVAEKDVTKDQRQIAKGINFGFIYGASAEGFQRLMEHDYGIKLPLEECTKFRRSYFATYPGFIDWYERSKADLRKFGYIEYPTGRFRRFPEVKGRFEIPDDVFRKAVNAPVQGSSSDIILFVMVRIRKIIEKYKLPVKMILTVHDSIVFDGPEKNMISDIIPEMKDICITDIPKHFGWLKVPMKFDYSIGQNWGGLVEQKS
jgi:uracil-DNA glycosylase family 4